MHVESGDATLGFSQVETDAAGEFSFPVQLGAQASVLVVQIEHDGGGASILVDLPAGNGGDPGDPEWYHDRSESALGFDELETDGPTYGLQPGETRHVSARVLLTEWEVWTDGHGGEVVQNATQQPLPGAEVSFHLEAGEGWLSASSATTGSDGRFAVSYEISNINPGK